MAGLGSERKWQIDSYRGGQLRDTFVDELTLASTSMVVTANSRGGGHH